MALIFPIENQEYYAGKIHFQVLREIPPEVSFSGAQVSEAENISRNFGVQVSNVYSSYIENGEVDVTETRYEYGDRATLFLPQAIQFQDGVVFDEFSLGRIGAGFEQALKNAEGFAGAFSGAFTDSISAITDLFNKSLSPDAARLAATRISKIGPEAAGAVRSALQTTANPNKRVLFKEVNIREFSFSFKLIPSSREEAENIKDLVKFFRTELYPDDSVVIGGVPLGYRFPNKFIVTFKHNEQTIAHKLLPSYLVSMQTVYNPSSMGFFEDGNFSEVDITMNFRESRTLSKRDVEAEGY